MPALQWSKRFRVNFWGCGCEVQTFCPTRIFIYCDERRKNISSRKRPRGVSKRKIRRKSTSVGIAYQEPEPVHTNSVTTNRAITEHRAKGISRSNALDAEKQVLPPKLNGCILVLELQFRWALYRMIPSLCHLRQGFPDTGKQADCKCGKLTHVNLQTKKLLIDQISWNHTRTCTIAGRWPGLGSVSSVNLYKPGRVRVES